jgi:hypothetical protein
MIYSQPTRTTHRRHNTHDLLLNETNRHVHSLILIKYLFDTVLLHKIQFKFINFNIKQLSLRVSRVDGYVWLIYQLQLH